MLLILLQKKSFHLVQILPNQNPLSSPKPCCHTAPLDLTGCRDDFPRALPFALPFDSPTHL